jgi:predicted nucleic acid-binding protein
MWSSVPFCLSNQQPGQAFYAALDRGDILLSLPVLKELIDVLGREKFERYLLREERERFLDALVRETTLVDITENICVCCDLGNTDFYTIQDVETARIVFPCLFTVERDSKQQIQASQRTNEC